MNTLIVRHVAKSEPAAFQVARLDGKSTDPVAVPSPVGFPVEGRPQSDLVRELRWYLEDFLDYPFPPETEHAERVLDALKQWGQQAFNALFDDRDGGRLFEAATREEYRNLRVQIRSDDPRILSWPWEALRDPQASLLAQTCQLERRVDRVVEPAAPHPDLPKDGVNILLVTARPMQNDVGFRSISRPLVESS